MISLVSRSNATWPHFDANLIQIPPSDAVSVVLLHSSSVHSILNRRAITKELLFKYLHARNVSVQENFTKQLLIDKTLHLWKQLYASKNGTQHSVHITEVTDSNYETDDDESSEVVMSESVTPEQSQGSSVSTSHDQAHFPINQMAREFANWFYTNLNAGTLREVDFWRDIECSAQFLERGVCMVDEKHHSSQNVLTFCQKLRTQYELFFNLNDSHMGTQGRMETHGLVLVLSCGTLHKTDQMVGIFECVFGLVRDPSSENNWKINVMRMRLHNNPIRPQHQVQQAIALDECETLAPLLSLTVSNSNDGIGWLSMWFSLSLV